MIRFSEHRGGLQEAIATRVTLGSEEDIRAHLVSVGHIVYGSIQVNPYAFDERRNAFLDIVTDDAGVLGFIER